MEEMKEVILYLLGGLSSSSQGTAGLVTSSLLLPNTLPPPYQSITPTVHQSVTLWKYTFFVNQDWVSNSTSQTKWNGKRNQRKKRLTDWMIKISTDLASLAGVHLGNYFWVGYMLCTCFLLRKWYLLNWFLKCLSKMDKSGETKIFTQELSLFWNHWSSVSLGLTGALS